MGTGEAPEAAIRALDAVVPEAVRAVCVALAAAGHQACTVGGAVRDALLGRIPGDWDVATSATPEQVMGLFDRTVPTGIQHGTVTVLAGTGRRRVSVEVTTFRGEGAYTDGRRPDEVIFGVPLREDLARRDFVVNAMAYDPVARALVDPFGGRADLAARRVRAVGDAAERFAEDGLRVMRAVRFAATLEFELEPATEAAIPGALPVLARVSRERVRVELMKLLGAPRPSRGLVIAQRTGVLDAILPELALPAGPDEHGRWARMLARVDAAGEAVLRLAALLVDAPGPLSPARSESSPLRRLKLSNAEIDRVDRLVRHAPAWAEELTDGQVRARLGALGRAYIEDLLALWQAEAAARAGDAEAVARLHGMIARVRGVVAAGDALGVGELALSGRDLMRTLGMEPGRAVGELLAALLARVLEEPGLNRPEALAELARELHAAGRVG